MREKTESTSPPRADLHEIQQMWVSLMRGRWSSLVVVPADPGLSAKAVTAALAEVAAIREVAPFQIIDAEGASPVAGEGLAKRMASVVASGSRAVAAVDSLIRSLGGIPLVRDAEAALLVLRFGSPNFEYLQSTIDVIGRDRILGAVTLPP